jgi:adenylate cyclase
MDTSRFLSIFLTTLLPLIASLAGVGIITYLTIKDRIARKRFQELRTHFEQYVPSHVADGPQTASQTEEREVDEVEATIMFTDLEGFTNLSERLEAKELVIFLNEYFSAVTAIVVSHQGTVDKFIGDSVMAIWQHKEGVNSSQAVAASLEIAATSSSFAQRAKALYGSHIRTRIGVNTGKVIVGPIGSPQRLSYTAIGDQVNLASRLEGANKHFNTEIIISESTAQTLPDGVLLRELDRIRVKGKSNPTRIFEARKFTDPEQQQQFELLNDWYAQGLECFRKKDWQRATRHLNECIFVSPADQPSLILMERCKALLAEAPSDDWDDTLSIEK